ncbi:helix-turn-helix transcriptional regulator [Streptomyces sp. CL12-4]|uniref:helix-turn-helix domain-containing protein n=1 Tax=Streptomyces sp. CL12-4 TaxID=2810306 RepID=UPI001EFBC337|nr:helix-turn-helix transcriptional regulator [Streptomyces sp. CL12-4]MCG8965268.1 helix-turn-helix transcriptional regulator [Streptomyces sp. CL12-4]
MNTVLEAGTRPLHGRAPEVSALRHAIQSAHRTGDLRISFEGTPGLGRSRLLAEAGAMAEAAGATVIRSLHGTPEVFDRPLVVLLDDIHCSDTADVRALAQVQLKAAGVPVVWCTTRRWGRPNSPLDVALGSLPDPHRLFRLRPLDDRAAQEMAHDLLGAEPEAAIARMVSCVSGHPQALRVLLEGLLEEGRVEVGPFARLTSTGLPEKFRGLVRRYLQDCSPSCEHLLLIASVLGTHLAFGELAEVLGTKPSRLLPDLREAVVSGLLSQDGDDVRFANGLFRNVILSAVPATAQAAVREQAQHHRAARRGAATEHSGRRAQHAAYDFAARPARNLMALPPLDGNTAAPALRRVPKVVTVLNDHPSATARNASAEGHAAPAPTGIPGWDRLTEKQVVIAGLTVQGLTNKEIAERLHLSPHTVNYHLRKIFQALSIRSRTDLVRLTHTDSAGRAPAHEPRPAAG